MPRIPRSFARRARSTASIFLGTPSGSACACISIAPLRVCAFADSEKTRNNAASCDLMDVPFIEQVSLELEVDLTRCMVRPCVARRFVELTVAVLHQCIRPLIGALLRAIMDISARAISLAAIMLLHNA